MLLQGGKSGPGAQQIRTGLDRLRQFRLGLGRVTETQVAESDQVMRVGRLEERRLSSATSATSAAAAGFGGRRLLERKLAKLQRPRWGLPGRLLVRRGYINRNRPSRIGSPDRRAQAYSRRPAWETDHGLRIQNLASMVFISSFGDYPVFNGLVRSLVLMEQFWSRVPAHAGSVSTFSDDGLE